MAAILALIGFLPPANTFLATAVALARTFWALTSLALMAAFLAGGAALRAFLRAATFLAALSLAFNAAFLTGLLTLASLALIAAILALIGLGFPY